MERIMITYKITYSLIHNEGNCVFRETKDRIEVVVERNHSFAQLKILKKHTKKDEISVNIKDIEPISIPMNIGGDRYGVH